MSMYNPIPRTVFSLAASGMGTTLSGAGATSTPPIDVLDCTDLWLATSIKGTATGTTPTLLVQVDALDHQGNVFAQILKLTSITSAPATGSGYVGLHSSGVVLPRFVQITWTLGGTTPVYPQVEISLTGR